MRDKRLDILKFFLIFLVVFAHIPYEGNGTLYKIIYSFHMPLFLAISGYCTTNKSWKDTLVSIRKVLKIYLVFTVLTLIAVQDKSEILSIDFWITPPLWYLEVIIIYRLAVKCLNDKTNFLSWKAISISFIMGWLIGFVPIEIMAFQRIFCFFPFFHLGYSIRNKKEMFSLVSRFDNEVICFSVLSVGVLMAIMAPSAFIPKYHYSGVPGIIGCPYKYVNALLMSCGCIWLLYEKMPMVRLIAGGGFYFVNICAAWIYTPNHTENS